MKEKMELGRWGVGVGGGGERRGNPEPDSSQEMKVKSHVFITALYLKWLRG